MDAPPCRATKDIFISYGREPAVNQFVRQLKSDLQMAGFTIWLDAEDIKSGTDWRAEIGSGLDNASAIVPVITQKYLGSRYCINELYSADGDQKMIFPIMFEDVDFSLSESAKGVKFVISGINWTMCRPGVDDYTISLEKLIGSMRDKGIGVSHFKSSAGDTRPTTAPCESSQTTQTDNSSIPLKPKSTKPVKVLLGFDSPNGVAVTGEGNIVVADMVTHQLIVYDKDYQKIGTIGGEGVEDGKFFCPQGVTVDHDNNILVTTYTMKCVHKFTVDGEFLGSAGTPGKGDCQFTAPYGLCVSKNTGNVYICDMSNNRIQILSKDLTYLGQFSDTDSEFGSGRLNSPTGIAIDNNGLLYVTDMMNHCIQVFDGEGKFLKRISKQGHLNGCLTAPTAIAIDEDELIHVADGMCRISTFTKFGVFVRSFGSNGAQLGSFTTPRGICYDHLKRMIVTEWSNNRVQIFQ